MADFQPQTFSLVAGTGYVFTLPKPIGAFTLLSRCECYVAFSGQGAKPSTPTSAAIPAAGQQTDYYHMLANEKLDSSIDQQINQQHEYPYYVSVWAVTAGNLTMWGVVHQ